MLFNGDNMQDGPIRVLCVFSSLDRGGAESMCMNLYRNIDRSKVQFDFVKHSSKHGAFEDEIISLGGKIYEAPRYKVKNHIAYCNWWEKHLLSHPEHIIVHGHFFSISAVFLRIARKMNRIAIAHAHTSTIKISSIKSFVKAQMLKKIKNNADYFFTCSNAAGDWLFPGRKYTVIKNAIDADLYRIHDVDKNSLNICCNSDDLIIGVVGSMTEVKNPFGTLRIFNEIHKVRPNSQLIWVGDGPLRNEVEQKITEYQLNDSVQLLGIRSDVSEILQIMDALIMPSFYEGLPVTLVEAQAAGLQCFVGDKVSMEANITGRIHYLPIDNIEAWVDSIISADLSKTDTYNNIKDAGYNVKDTAMFIQNFYCNILGEREK